MDDFEQFKTLVEEATAGVTVVKTAREQEVGPEDVTGLLQSHGRTWMDKSCSLRMSKESGFLGWNLQLVKMLWRLLEWQQSI